MTAGTTNAPPPFDKPPSPPNAVALSTSSSSSSPPSLPVPNKHHPIKPVVALHQDHLDTLLLEAKSLEEGREQDLTTVTTDNTSAPTDPGSQFASNDTASTITIPGSGIMDYQTVEAESLLSEAARRKSRRLV
jgi:hypothetical protein